jgi:DNA-binding MarR family transcriptional regulator
MNMLDRKYLALLEATSAQPEDVPRLRTCFCVLALASAIDRDCASRLQAYGLSEGRFVVLVVLLEAGGGLAPYALAERVGVTRATMTGLLDGLARDKLIARRRDRHDRRSININLTSEGMRLAQQAKAAHARWIASLTSDLANEEQDVLQRLLTRIWQRTGAAGSAKATHDAPEEAHEGH